MCLGTPSIYSMYTLASKLRCCDKLRNSVQKKTLLHGTRLTRPPDSSRTAAAAAINKTRLQHRKNTIFSAEEEMRYKLRPSWIFWVRKFDYGSGEASWCMDCTTASEGQEKQTGSRGSKMIPRTQTCPSFIIIVTTIQSQSKFTWNWITTHLPYFSRKLSGEGLQTKHIYCHLSPLNGGCTPPSSNSPWILPATSASKMHDMVRRTAARNSCEKWSKVGDLGQHVPNLIPTAWHGDWQQDLFLFLARGYRGWWGNHHVSATRNASK